jgi:hypothetical protein
LADSGFSFEQALETLSRASVEAVLTSHPTQIQSSHYRLLWRAREESGRRLQEIEAGYPGRLTVEQEAQETADLFLGNL